MTILDFADGPVVDAAFTLEPAKFAVRRVVQALDQLVKGHHALQHAGKPAPLEVPRAGLAALPDERQSRHASATLDVKQIVAANLKAWRSHAKEEKMSSGSVLGLARAAELSRPAITDIENGAVACATDTLQRLAAVFGMVAWQMLVPGHRPPLKPRLADQQIAADEFEAMVQSEVARRIRAGEALQYVKAEQEAGRSGRAVENVVAGRSDAASKSKRKADATEGAATKAESTRRPGKPIPKRRLAAKTS